MLEFEFYACGPFSSEETKKRWRKHQDEMMEGVNEIHYVIDPQPQSPPLPYINIKGEVEPVKEWLKRIQRGEK